LAEADGGVDALPDPVEFRDDLCFVSGAVFERDAHEEPLQEVEPRDR